MKYRKLLGTVLASTLVLSAGYSVWAETSSAATTTSTAKTSSASSSDIDITAQMTSDKPINTFADALNVAIENNINLKKMTLDRDLSQKKLEDAIMDSDLTVNDITGGRGSADAVANAKVSKEVGLELAKNGVFLADKQIDLSKLQLKKDLEDAYLTYAEAQESLNIANINYQQAQKNFAQVKKRFQVGTITQADLIKADAVLSQAQLGVESAKSSLTTAKQNLNMIIFKPMDNDITFQDPNLLNTVDLSKYSLDKLVELAKKNRPDFLSQQTTVKTEQEKLDIYKQVYRSNSNMNVIEQGYNIQKQELSLVDLERNMQLQISQILEGINLAKQQLIIAQKNLDASKESQRVTEAKFKSGLSVDLEVLSANIDVMQKNQALLDAKYNLAKAFRNLYYTIGTQLN